MGVLRPRLVPGHSCRRLARASRCSLVVDGEAYFRALAHSLAAARRQILFAGWDMDPRVKLWRGDDPGPPPPPGPPWARDRPLPPELGPLLDELVRRRRQLRAYVLAWDFGTVFAVKRSFVPVYHFDWDSHRRVLVRLDGEHPFGSSLHVKSAVIDDRVAYVGGIDLSRYRWDRHGHPAVEPLRVDPDGNPYRPWHDLMWCVDGDAAAAVADELRTRWQGATRRALAPPDAGGAPWPVTVPVDLHDVEVGIVRTVPAWEGRPDVREVEALYLESIARARRTVYLENQYLTSARVADALARRLREPDGPDVVIVSSLRSSGYLEHASMDVLRSRFIETLRRADAERSSAAAARGAPEGSRLSVLYPVTGTGEFVKVHAKHAVFDDDFVQLGSSNLAGRSMGLDVELDLALEAIGPWEDQVRAFLPGHRDGLLAEHLGCTRDDVAAARAEHGGSLRAAVEALRARGPGHDGHELRPMPVEHDGPVLPLPPELADPEHTVDLAYMASRLVPDGRARSALAAAVRGTAGLLLIGALELAWKGVPAHFQADATGVDAAIEHLARATVVAPVEIAALLTALVLSSVVPFPSGALVVLAGFAFGGLTGAAVSTVGLTLGCVLGWATGRLLGRRFVHAMPFARVNAVSRRLAQPGVAPVAELRLLPRHTFSEVNLVAGASGKSLRDLLPGTIVGIAPGTLVLAGVGHLVATAIRAPNPLNLGVATVAVTLITAVLLWLWRRQDLLPAR